MFRAFDSWRVRGRWRIRRLQTETGVRKNLPRFGPSEGKDLYPACLILYCLYIWSCYNGAQMRSGGGGRRWRVLTYARGIYARSDMSLSSWPPLLALIWGARSQDPVQAGYRWLRTLTSLGLLGLRVSSCSWAAAGMLNMRTRGVVPSSLLKDKNSFSALE
jgi:hypothetical protein